MQITCPSCQKGFLLDDAKVPDKPVRMKCPSCGGAIPVGPAPSAAPQADAPSGDFPIPAQAMPFAPGSPEYERLKKEVAAEVLRHLGIKVGDTASGLEDECEEDGRSALVVEDEALFQVAVSEALDKLGFHVETAGTRDEALTLLERKPFDLVTVDNRLPDDPEGGYKILQAINGLPPEQRRKMFVAYISADLSTMDTQSAFILGANLTVGKKDVKRLDKILSDGMRDHHKAYATFFQVADEIQAQES
jgi:predicted Zn finger-like uncharacterized protein